MPPIVRALRVAALALGVHAAALSAQSAAAAAGGPRTLRVSGVERTYLLDVPPSYRPGTPAPLVMVFHGAGGSGRRMAPHTGFSRLAGREGFVAVYPDGLGRRWNDGRSALATRDDVGFVKALLDTLERELSLDSTRVYAAGISNGAMFSYRLACELPGVFAAIAPVAGATPANLAESCGRTAPVSVLAIQGTADPLLPYAGGGVGGGRGSVLSAAREHRVLGPGGGLRRSAGRHRRARPCARRHAGAGHGLLRLPRRACGGALHHPGRRTHLARRAAGGTVGGPGEPGDRCDGVDLGVLREASEAVVRIVRLPSRTRTVIPSGAKDLLCGARATPGLDPSLRSG